MSDVKQNISLKEIKNKIGIAFMLRLFAAGLSFAVIMTVAKLLSVEDAGLYFLLMSLVIMMSDFARVGLDNAVVRYIAEYATSKNWSGVNSVYVVSMIITTLVASILILLIIVLSPLISEYLFKNLRIGEPLIFISLAILPLALLNIQAQCLKGLFEIKRATLIQGVGVPLLTLCTIIPLAIQKGIMGAILSYSISTAIVSIIGIWVWKRRVRIYENLVMIGGTYKQIFKSSAPLFVSSIFWTVQVQSPVLMLGMLSSPENVAIFGVATRISMIVNILLTTTAGVVAPKFSEYIVKNEHGTLKSISRKLSFYLLLCGVAAFLFTLAFGEQILGLFGGEYKQGEYVLLALIFGQMINASSGMIANVLLIAAGEEKKFRNIIVTSSILQIVITYYLIEMYQALGAALAVSITMIWTNYWLNAAIKKIFGFSINPFAQGLRQK